MRYMLMLYSDENAWASFTPAQQAEGMAAYGAYVEALKKAGAFVATERLRPTSTATVVRNTNGKAEVLDGPYLEAKEQMGGYFVIEAPDLDGAIAWAARCPAASHGTVELRPIWPAEGVAPAARA
jgi:hypothetical protein